MLDTCDTTDAALLLDHVDGVAEHFLILWQLIHISVVSQVDTSLWEAWYNLVMLWGLWENRL